jgi:hypothetical protein
MDDGTVDLMSQSFGCTNMKVALLTTLIVTLSVASLFIVPFMTSAASATVTLKPKSVLPGHSVSVTGLGFQTNSSVYIYFGGSSGQLVVTTTSNSSGGFVTKFNAPAVAPGTYVVTAESCCLGGTTFASANLVIKTGAVLTVKPVAASVGKTVEVSGTGFAASKTITVSLGTTMVGSATSNSTGGFSTTFVVPQIPGGRHTLNATDGTTTGTKSFTVRALVSLKPIKGLPGITDVITGTGFAENSTIKVTFNAVQVMTGTSNSTGGFAISYTVPNLVAGTYVVAATDASSGTASHSFTIS